MDNDDDAPEAAPEDAPAHGAPDAAPEDAQGLCIACEERPRMVRLLPCSHATMCTDCSVRLIGTPRATAPRCPTCRSVFNRVECIPADELDPPRPRRIPTYEPPASDGMSIKEFMLNAAIEPFVKFRRDVLPVELMLQVSSALDALEGDTTPLFHCRRDSCWVDVIDPDLCLTPPQQPGAAHWQTAEAVADTQGSVRWASWVNHLETELHGPLLASLAALLTLALPSLEAVGGVHVRGSQFQVVVTAFKHELAPAADANAPAFYRISDWHTDGAPEEHVLATATCYIEIGAGLTGGALEFARQAEVWVDDPEATLVVRPESGAPLAPVSPGFSCCRPERLHSHLTPSSTADCQCHLLCARFPVASRPKERYSLSTTRCSATASARRAASAAGCSSRSISSTLASRSGPPPPGCRDRSTRLTPPSSPRGVTKAGCEP